jgi:hypothetical protein
MACGDGSAGGATCPVELGHLSILLNKHNSQFVRRSIPCDILPFYETSAAPKLYFWCHSLT